MAKSSQNRRRQILGVISAARAEQMLVEWVNTDLTDLQENANTWERLFRRCHEIPSPPLTQIVPVTEKNFDRFHQQMEMAVQVGHYLRRAWDAPDIRSFEWFAWKAQAEYEQESAQAVYDVTPSHIVKTKVLHDAYLSTMARFRKEKVPAPTVDTEKELTKIEAAMLAAEEPPTTITPVEAAIFHLRHNRKRALHCPNPECPAPYFFSSKKGQKYCSPECGKPAQRESKRKWWAENRAKENL